MSHFIKSMVGCKEISKQPNAQALFDHVSMLYNNMPRYNFDLYNSKGIRLNEHSLDSLLTQTIHLAFKSPLVYSLGSNP